MLVALIGCSAALLCARPQLHSEEPPVAPPIDVALPVEVVKPMEVAKPRAPVDATLSRGGLSSDAVSGHGAVDREPVIGNGNAAEAVRPPRSLPTTTVMHAKLTCTQHVLAGLLSEDFPQVARSAAALQELARDVPPRTIEDGLNDSVYEHFRLELLRLSGDLQRMASERNLNGAAYVHGNITATCIGCHKHLRDPGEPIELLSRPADLFAR